MAQKNVKKRNWAFIVYPESAPADWVEQLQLTGLQCEISPLHDKDLNPDGTPKKPHYHVIVCYSGPASFNVVKSLTDRLNQPVPQALEQVKGYHRYLTHMDNPEKYQYNCADIQTLNGFNILDYCDLTRSEVLEYKKEICALIREKDFCEYSVLLDFLLDNDLSDLFDCASSNTVLFNNYIKSRRWRREPEELEKIKKELQESREIIEELKYKIK